MEKYYLDYRLESGSEKGLAIDGTSFFRIELTGDEFCSLLGKEVVETSPFRDYGYLRDRKLELGKVLQGQPNRFKKPKHYKDMMIIKPEELGEFTRLYEEGAIPTVHQSLMERFIVSKLANRHLSARLLFNILEQYGLKPQEKIKQGEVYRLMRQNYGWGLVNPCGLFTNVNRTVKYLREEYAPTKAILKSPNSFSYYSLDMEDVYLNSDIIDLYESLDKNSNEFKMLDLTLKNVLDSKDALKGLKDESQMCNFN